MLDPDRALVSALMRDGEGGFTKLNSAGFSPELVVGEEAQKSLAYILGYHKKYGQFPTTDTFHEGTGLYLDPCQEPLLAIRDELVNRRIIDTVKSGSDEVGKAMEQRDGIAAIAALEAILFQIRKQQLTGGKVDSIFKMGPAVLAYYDDIKAGKRGIPLPWPSITEQTLGLWPEDVAMFVARLGVGKSWMAIMLALSAYESGNKVLFVTTEMSKLRIAMRMYSIKLKIGYDDISKARLPPWQEAIFREKVDGLLESPLFDIIGGDFDFSLGAYRAAIEESQPKIVVLDGAYLIKADGKNRSEQMATAMNEIKRIGVQLKVPQALTSQFNREVKSNSPNTVDNGAIALSDVAGWNATLIVGMVQTDAMKKDRRMILKPLKMREGSGEDLEANWDFSTMNFSEVNAPAVANPGVPVPAGSTDPAVASDQSLLF